MRYSKYDGAPEHGTLEVDEVIALPLSEELPRVDQTCGLIFGQFGDYRKLK